MWERVEGSWVKKADSANVGEIVDTITTDELLAKKFLQQLVITLR